MEMANTGELEKRGFHIETDT